MNIKLHILLPQNSSCPLRPCPPHFLCLLIPFLEQLWIPLRNEVVQYFEQVVETVVHGDEVFPGDETGVVPFAEDSCFDGDGVGEEEGSETGWKVLMISLIIFGRVR